MLRLTPCSLPGAFAVWGPAQQLAATRLGTTLWHTAHGLSNFAAAVAEAPAAAPAAGSSNHNASTGDDAIQAQSNPSRTALSLSKLAQQPALSLSHFLRQSAGRASLSAQVPLPASSVEQRTVYLETYGCQMNVNDSEVVLSVLADHGYRQTQSLDDADVVLLNTCAIRDNAEQKIWTRLGQLKAMKLARRKTNREQPAPVVGVLGCMAERLKIKLLESDRSVDIVAGPDAYRDVPRLIEAVQGSASSSGRSGGGAMNVQLSLEETYADIVPLRPAGTVSAFLSIMRGCNNMCAFCVVPFTRGRERSRPAASILDEVRMLSDQGVKEVTLLGQNVNSYADFTSTEGASTASDPSAVYAQGFTSVYRPKREGAVRFAELLDTVASVNPEMRVRFTSPHPKDFTDDVLQVIASRPNVCKQLHMPAQSGSSSMLTRMRRGYTREAYDALVTRVRQVIPQVALSTDIIAGFCGETEEEHAATVDLLRSIGYDQAFLFAYSERAKTQAARHLQDDVPAEVKSVRLQKLIATYREGLHQRNQQEVGRRHLVLVEGPSRKTPAALTGKTCTMKRVVFDDHPVPASYAQHQQQCQQQWKGRPVGLAGPDVGLRPGDYVAVQVQRATAGTLYATALARTSLQEFVGVHGTAVPQAAYAGDDGTGIWCPVAWRRPCGRVFADLR